MPISASGQLFAPGVVIRGRVLRELAPPPRIGSDQRVDMPEIQVPYRVSFSEQARAATAEMARDPRQYGASEANARALERYREVAGL